MNNGNVNGIEMESFKPKNTVNYKSFSTKENFSKIICTISKVNNSYLNLAGDIGKIREEKFILYKTSINKNQLEELKKYYNNYLHLISILIFLLNISYDEPFLPKLPIKDTLSYRNRNFSKNFYVLNNVLKKSNYNNRNFYNIIEQDPPEISMNIEEKNDYYTRSYVSGITSLKQELIILNKNNMFIESNKNENKTKIYNILKKLIYTLMKLQDLCVNGFKKK